MEPGGAARGNPDLELEEYSGDIKVTQPRITTMREIFGIISLRLTSIASAWYTHMS